MFRFHFYWSSLPQCSLNALVPFMLLLGFKLKILKKKSFKFSEETSFQQEFFSVAMTNLLPYGLAKSFGVKLKDKSVAKVFTTTFHKVKSNPVEFFHLSPSLGKISQIIMKELYFLKQFLIVLQNATSFKLIENVLFHLLYFKFYYCLNFLYRFINIIHMYLHSRDFI